MNNEEELSDFCVAMMFAGHDTTLASIQSCLHWLKQCPDVECRLREARLMVFAAAESQSLSTDPRNFT